MATRFDWNALDEKIESILRDYEDIDNRSKALTAIALTTILEISLEEAIDSLTDASQDRGVDAIFIDDRESRKDVHIFQTKCVSNFENSKKNFPSGEIDKISSYVSDLISEESNALLSANTLLRKKTFDALEIIKKTNSRIFIYFIGNMMPMIVSEMSRATAIFDRYRAVQFKMLDLDSLSDFFLEKKAPNLNREISVIDTNFFDRTDRNLRGLVCTVSANDIVNLIRSENDPSQVELGIFDQNVRVFLKKNNKINAKIMESAKGEDNHMFWYQNNGITMTCDKIEIGPARRSPSIGLKNVQIVNGGQTSNCLFEVSKTDPEKLDDVLVLLRIIETSSEDVKYSVSEATNSQTPINSRDLRANDRQQRQLEDNFVDLGYFYERKTKQHDDKPGDNKIDALTAGQAYLAYSLSLPEVAKKDRGRIFGDLYDNIYSEDLTASKLLHCYKIFLEIEKYKSVVRKKIRNGEVLEPGEISLIDGAYHALFACAKILEKRDESLYDFNLARAHIDEAIGVVSRIYIREADKNPNFSSNRFFKEAKTKEIIVREV